MSEELTLEQNEAGGLTGLSAYKMEPLRQKLKYLLLSLKSMS